MQRKRVLKTGAEAGAPVLVVNRSLKAEPRHLRLIKKCARKALEILSLKGELSIAVVDDPEMREINRTYKKASKTTDVLSFEQGENGLIGDVIISFETARRRAGLYGITIEEEIKRLVVHGTAHLAGHTHKRRKDGAEMRAEESKILSAVSKL